jgi:DNA-binding transcriptional ArsR family regulator
MGNPPTHLQVTNPGQAEALSERLLPREEAQKLARQAHAVSDPNRITLLALLRDAKQSCVGDLCLITGLEQSGVSRNLRILWSAGLLERWVLDRSAMYRPTETGERLLDALIGEGP